MQAKKKGLMAKMWGLRDFVVGNKTGQKDKVQIKAEEEVNVLATRFLTFDEDCVLLLSYLPQKPTRDFMNFSSRPGERSRPLPDIEWDSINVRAERMHHLKTIIFANYHLVEKLKDPSESLVTV